MQNHHNKEYYPKNNSNRNIIKLKKKRFQKKQYKSKLYKYNMPKNYEKLSKME